MRKVKEKVKIRKQENKKALAGTKRKGTSLSSQSSTLRGHFTIKEHFGSKPIGECFREFLERVYPDLLLEILRKEEG